MGAVIEDSAGHEGEFMLAIANAPKSSGLELPSWSELRHQRHGLESLLQAIRNRD